MNRFATCFAKFTIVVCIALAIVLASVTALLIFAPKLLLSILYYALIGIGIIGTLYLVICLLKVAFMSVNLKRGGQKNAN